MRASQPEYAPAGDQVEISSALLDTAVSVTVAGEVHNSNGDQFECRERDQRGSAVMVRYGEDDQSPGPELPPKGAPPPANEPPLLSTLVWFLLALAAVVVLTLLAQEPGSGIGI
jgi:hypothetical protein